MVHCSWMFVITSVPICHAQSLPLFAEAKGMPGCLTAGMTRIDDWQSCQAAAVVMGVPVPPFANHLGDGPAGCYLKEGALWWKRPPKWWVKPFSEETGGCSEDHSCVCLTNVVRGMPNCAASGMTRIETWDACQAVAKKMGIKIGQHLGNGPAGCYLMADAAWFNTPGAVDTGACTGERSCICDTAVVSTSATTIAVTTTTIPTIPTMAVTPSATATTITMASTSATTIAVTTTTIPTITVTPTATTTSLTSLALTNACMRGLIQCRVDHAFDGFDYYVNGSSSIPACRSPAWARSASGNNITFNMSICKPFVRNSLTHQHTSITLIPVLPWYVIGDRIPGPITCVCRLGFKKMINGTLSDLVASDKEEKRHFEVDGLVMQLNNATGKFIIDISSRVFPVVRIESCKISDGGVNELHLLENFLLLSPARWNHMKQLRVNISKMPQSSAWQLQMRSFALPNSALIHFSCTVHHCADNPCPRTVRRLTMVEYSTGLGLLRRLSSGSLITSISGDPNGVVLDFNQRIPGLTTSFHSGAVYHAQSGNIIASCNTWSKLVAWILIPFYVGVCLFSQMW